MRRLVTTVAVLAALAAPSVSQAQSKYFWVGGMSVMGSGDTKDAVDNGLGATVGLGFGLGMKSLSLQLEGIWAKNDSKLVDGSGTMMGGLVNLELELLKESKIMPYVFGGAGLINSKFEDLDGDTKLGYQFGGGLSLKVGAKLHIWADVRYLARKNEDPIPNSTFLPISAGIAIPFGN